MPSASPAGLVLYNSLTRRKERFVPQDSGRVTMYACGPTVYNPPHIGNARAAVVYDLLYRVLKRHYANVIYARNITDVDDKINLAAQQEGVPISVISQRYIDIYHRDVAALGVLPPVLEPRATEHIETIINMIDRLIVKNHAYVAQDHVLFSVPSFKDYGKLSRRTRDELIAGARVDVVSFKRDPADFVLWKPSESDLPGWNSPWGRGRPGWHIECSAMIARHLGTTIDIHGGGNDLKFPHHENEIAQSTCAHDGNTFCRYWVHNGFVEIDSEKMSKSIGNVTLVHELLQRHHGETLRLTLLRTRYREPINWTEDQLIQAKGQLDRIYGALQRLEDVVIDETNTVDREFLDAMDDDLNTPLALSILMRRVNAANASANRAEKAKLKALIVAATKELGIAQNVSADWFSYAPAQGLDVRRIEALVEQRQQARANKDWSTADKIRDELATMGVRIEDASDRTTWRVE